MFRKAMNTVGHSLLDGLESFSKSKSGEKVGEYLKKTARGAYSGGVIGAGLGLGVSPFMIDVTLKNPNFPVDGDVPSIKGKVPRENITRENIERGVGNAVECAAGFAKWGAQIGAWRITGPWCLFKAVKNNHDRLKQWKWQVEEEVEEEKVQPTQMKK